MQKRVDGNTIILESSSGETLLTTEVQGSRAILRHGDWSMVKDMGMDPHNLLSSVDTSNAQRACLKFYDITIELNSDLPGLVSDVLETYERFSREEIVEADVIIHAFSGSFCSNYPFTMVVLADSGVRIKGDFSAVSYFRNMDDLLFQIHSDIEVLFLTNNPKYSFIHGGSVEKNGTGFMLPAVSGSGKTTLVLALMQAGYTVYSDEFAVLDNLSGNLLPFQRSLSVREDSLRLFPMLKNNTSEYSKLSSPKEVLYNVPLTGDQSLSTTCPVRYIIFPEYRRDTTPTITSISRMAAFRRLVDSQNFISLGTSEKQRSIDLMLSVISQAECYDLTTGDPTLTVSIIDSLGV